MATKSTTVPARRRRTSRRVLWTDRAARVLITLGGAGTILAVSTVFVFLAWVVVPLFVPPRFEPAGAVPLTGEPPAAFRVDEQGRLGWAWRRDGSVTVFQAGTGRVLSTRRPFGDAVPTAAAFASAEGRAVFGFADGTVRFADLGFARDDLRFEAGPPVELAKGRSVVRLDLTLRGTSPRLAACSADGTLWFEEATTVVNLLTDESRTKVSGGTLVLPATAGRGPPDFLLMGGVGTMAFAAWKDGRCLRIDTRDVEKPVVAEVVDLLGDRTLSLTTLGFLIGKTTLVAGDSGGRIRTWFTVRPAGAPTVDGSVLVAAHALPGPAAAVASTAPSERTRLLAAGYADGTVRLFHVTSERLLGEGRAPAAAAPVALAPKDDALLAWSGGSLGRWTVDAPHPETTLHSIFGKVWYEGAERPEHVWQSSSGTDDFEPKYGLTPLVFGTLKATLFSMLFSIPIALLAAVHTSEFLRPEVRARVKPVIELMASLPSVVLGFLAALIFAPVIESRVPAVLASFATVPVAVLAGAHLWQLLPRGTAARWERRRLWFAGAAVPLGFLAAHLLGGIVERVLFDGDVKSWLDGGRGTGRGGWFLLLLPACGLATALLAPRIPVPSPARGREAGASALRFALGVAGATAAAWIIASALAALGFDPRGSVMGTFVQRNALVVGVLMGFAVIPIVYTLAEDALASVPEHLRAASLAVGATRWQTAVAVILPTATSGLFSACMIGLGRAVGETMVVLMAAGNTPIMEWNPFNGFRTLSANIAVELPEAVQGGTNFRMLFLAALCLFAITFVLNTAAELVRQRFRRRAFEL